MTVCGHFLNIVSFCLSDNIYININPFSYEAHYQLHLACTACAEFPLEHIFFTMRMPVLGMIDILLLDASVIWFMMAVSKKDKPALYMFIPYILWLVIATYLNGYIVMNN